MKANQTKDEPNPTRAPHRADQKRDQHMTARQPIRDKIIDPKPNRNITVITNAVDDYDHGAIKRLHY